MEKLQEYTLICSRQSEHGPKKKKERKRWLEFSKEDEQLGFLEQYFQQLYLKMWHIFLFTVIYFPSFSFVLIKNIFPNQQNRRLILLYRKHVITNINYTYSVRAFTFYIALGQEFRILLTLTFTLLTKISHIKAIFIFQHVYSQVAAHIIKSPISYQVHFYIQSFSIECVNGFLLIKCQCVYIYI